MDPGTTITLGEEAEAPSDWDSMVTGPEPEGDDFVGSDADHSTPPTPPEDQAERGARDGAPRSFDAWIEEADIEDLDAIADRLAAGEIEVSDRDEDPASTEAGSEKPEPPSEGDGIRSIADDDGPARARVRLTNADDRAVVELAKSEGISLLEAATRVLAEKRSAASAEIDALVEVDPEAAAEEAAADKADQADQAEGGEPLTVAEAEARLYELEAEADKAQFEDYDDRRAYELRREVRELRRRLPQIAEAERRAKDDAMAKAKAEYDRQWSDAEARAHALFPELAESPDTSPIMAEMRRLDAEAKASDPDLWSSPTKYFDLAVRAAIALRKSPMSASPNQTAPGAPRNPAARGVVAAPTARASAAVPAANRFEERLEEIQTADDMADFDLALGIR